MHRWGRLLKQPSSITVYDLPTKENKLPFSVSCLQLTNGNCRFPYIYPAVSNGQWKPRQFSFIHLPFAHRAHGSLSFFHLLMKKQIEVIHLQTDWTEREKSRIRISRIKERERERESCRQKVIEQRAEGEKEKKREQKKIERASGRERMREQRKNRKREIEKKE